ncbi:MAG TPA: NB-ARC domain-containing protein [Ktedonobacteraceae bacterium]|nr:NB-ARC domain-containing protein [Ktedonobacteraceae bacterium]
MSSRKHGDNELFCDSVQNYLHTSGYTQKELADALGLHPKVLSRKLHGSGNAYLTHQEIRCIITTLAEWHVIATQDEGLRLLELAQVKPTIFSPDAWQAPPLNTLTKKHTQPIPTNTSSDSSMPMSPLQHNLPIPATRLIGREWAVDRIQQLLGRDDVRLLTLVGAGGSGKTRLALHVARELVDSFAQGAWFVSLASVSDPTQVPMSIIQALNLKPTAGFPPLQSLVTYLRHKQMLLVLDNFEQVGEATAVVDEILTAAPGLKVLVTSRTVLRLYGEHEFSVPPLDMPDPNAVEETTDISHYGAIQLFVERAQAAMPDFVLTAKNRAIIAQICARVDGLPLALELAAARVKVLPLELLLERLSRARLSMLTGGPRNLPSRQQTLRNTFTWSYELLPPVEQGWFPRLGVFIGSCSLEAVEAMMQAIAVEREDTPVFSSVLDMLEQLVDSSLLVRLSMAGEQARFTMLETLREYALERLTTQEKFERLRDWHAHYYLDVVEAAEIGLRGPQQLMWLARLVADRDNFRAAFEWSLQRAKAGMSIHAPSFFEWGSLAESERVAGSKTLSSQATPDAELPAVELCLRLAAALRPYWEWQGYLDEGRSWLGAALAVSFESEIGKTMLAARAKALSEDARLVCLQNEQTQAIELAEASIALWRQLDDARGLATALLHRGWPAHALGEYEDAKRVYKEGLQLLSSPDDTWLRAQLLFYLAAAEGFTSNFEQMQSLYTQSRRLFEQLGDKISIADLLKDQGGLAILEGKCTEAIDLLLKSIKLCYEVGHRQFVATCMGSLGFAFGLQGEPDPELASIYSAKLSGAAEGLMDAIGLTPWTRTLPMVLMVRQHIRSRVDDQRWEAAWSEGRTFTAKQAIDLAYRLAGRTFS